jgi:hypothetical protein
MAPYHHLEDNIMWRPLRRILASLLLCISYCASAQIATQVRYGTFSYTLVDLDPNDGIAPWATLSMTGSTGTATVFGPAGTTLDECTIGGIGSCTAATADGAGTAWFAGLASGGRTTWSASAYGGAHATTRADFAFSLSPRTQATFAVDLSIRQQGTAAGFSAGGTFYFVQYRYGDPPDDEGFFGSDENRPGDHVSTFTLASRDQPMYGEIFAYTDLASTNFPPPVPEPPAWAMLAGGLLLVARHWHFQRRRLRRAPNSSARPIPISATVAGSGTAAGPAAALSLTVMATGCAGYSWKVARSPVVPAA